MCSLLKKNTGGQREVSPSIDTVATKCIAHNSSFINQQYAYQHNIRCYSVNAPNCLGAIAQSSGGHSKNCCNYFTHNVAFLVFKMKLAVTLWNGAKRTETCWGINTMTIYVILVCILLVNKWYDIGEVHGVENFEISDYLMRLNLWS